MTKDTHYGDEDPEFHDDEADAELEEELFELARFAGHTPKDMQGDRAFAARYAAWLARHG
jgi:hypothetical protein